MQTDTLVLNARYMLMAKNVHRDNCMSQMQCFVNALQLWGRKQRSGEKRWLHTLAATCGFTHTCRSTPFITWPKTLSGGPASTEQQYTSTSEWLQSTPDSSERSWSHCLTFCPSMSTHTITRSGCLHRARAGRKKCILEQIQRQENAHCKMMSPGVLHPKLRHCNASTFTGLLPPHVTLTLGHWLSGMWLCFEAWIAMIRSFPSGFVKALVSSYCLYLLYWNTTLCATDCLLICL